MKRRGQGFHEKSYMKRAISGSIILGAAGTLIISAVSLIYLPQILGFLNISEELMNESLKVNTVFYFLPAMICNFRNSMQGFGDTKTLLVSSFIELAGKVLIAFLLAPVIGYMGIIISEPIVWVFMVIPLLVGMARNPIMSLTIKE